jgi:hypothetical protein
VNITSPNGGDYSSGAVPVSWSASDSDDDVVQVAMLYSADGGASWMPVAFGKEGDSVELPVEQLAGSDDARIRVVASDGFHSSSATSNPFSVAAQPPLPFIGHPVSATLILEGDRLNLAGGAHDNQDGLVADASLAWRSDRDGALGSGAELGAFLSVGNHVLTLEAQNSAGMTATATVSVTVLGDYDYDGLTDLEELADNLNLLTAVDAYGDADRDGLPLIMERNWGTDPDSTDTDGDGRSDADEIAAGTTPTLQDDPLPPDELVVSPSKLTFDADLSLDTPFPQQPVVVSSRDVTSWTLSADVDWLAASDASGQTVAGPTIMVDVYKLADGVHNGHLIFTSDELDSNVRMSVTVTVTNHIAHFDVNRDGSVDVKDVQEVNDRVGTDNSQDGFSYRHDLDRDGDVDVVDLQLIMDVVFPDKVFLPIVLR